MCIYYVYNFSYNCSLAYVGLKCYFEYLKVFEILAFFFSLKDFGLYKRIFTAIQNISTQVI